MTEDLTASERELLTAAESGQRFIGDGQHAIRAKVIRDLLLARYSVQIDKSGLQLCAAQVTGPLKLDEIDIPAGLSFHSCQLESVSLDNARLPWIKLRNTRINGQLSMSGADVRGHLEIADSSKVSGSDPMGAINFYGAKVGGYILLSALSVKNQVGPAVNFERLQTQGSVIFHDVTAIGTGNAGAIWIDAAEIGARLELTDLRVNNNNGPAVGAQMTNIQGSLWLTGLDARGRSEAATFSLHNVQIQGDVHISDCRFIGLTGPALRATGLEVGGNFLVDDSEATGVGPNGALILTGSSATSFHFERLECRNGTGPGVRADSITATRSFMFTESTVHGCGEWGAVNLAYSQFTAGLSFEGSRIRNPDPEGYAVDLRVVSTGRVYLPRDLACRTGDGTSASWQADGALDLDGFRYTSFSRDDPGVTQWIKWLRSSPEYAAQPYQQLAATYRRAGHETDARRILVLQQDQLLLRGLAGGWWRRLSRRLLRLTLGYGYQTSRALLGLLVVVFAAITLGLVAGTIHLPTNGYLAAHTTKTPHPGTQCSIIERVGLGLDRALPIISTGTKERCDLDSTTVMGQLATALAWVLQFAGWAFATLALVGYTGLVRRL